MLWQHYPQLGHIFKYELNRDMNFSAAHFIPHKGAGHCSTVHGHTYVVNITVCGNELDEMGFLVNFSQLKKLIHGKYDHTLMNDHPEFTKEFYSDSKLYPTTEIVAKTIWRIIQNYLDNQPNAVYCTQVYVRETPTSYVVYRPTQEDFDKL